MKIIINTTNLVIGGGLQVALSFLHEVKCFSDNIYFVFLSAQIDAQIDKALFPDNFFFYNFEQSPASIRNRRTVLKRLELLEEEIRPDIVFSVFGPSYWTPQAPHVMGVADGWCYSPDSVVWKKVGLFNRMRVAALTRYKTYHYKKNADYYVVETSAVKTRIEKYWKVCSQNISVVQNTYSALYESTTGGNYNLPEILSGAFRLVTISADYLHKNLEIIHSVVPQLEKLGVNCVFILTLPEETYQQKYAVLGDWVVNLGPVPVNLCPSIYSQCNALFLPTLLESFTASYPEAMKMKLPILTSDLDFAHAICGDAAEYFEPLNPVDIAAKIQNIVTNHARRAELISLGYERLKIFPTARQRADMYLSICKDLVSLAGK